MDNIEKLYKIYGLLADAKDNVSEYEKEYLESLAAVKGSSSEKRLASQIITRFFKHFPHLASQAIDAELDLCEDDDVAIRKQAIKDLPSLCKDSVECLSKIADVLTQLLQTDDTGELTTLHATFMTLFKIDCKGTLGGLFFQICNGEDLVRERAIKFLSNKIKSLPEDIMTKDVEEFFMQECKKVFQDVTADEFLTFMNILATFKISKTLGGHQFLVEIIAEQAGLDKEFEYSDPDNIDKLIHCIKQALPYFSSQVNSSRFMEYFCDKVLPVMVEVTRDEVQVELLKLLAELSTHCGVLDDAQGKMDRVFNKLLEYMPLPHADENGENAPVNYQLKMEFSHVECLMYTFHQLGKRHPDFLTSETNAEKLKDFKIRLQYFARRMQAYIKKLREALQGKKGEELKMEQNKFKVVALKITSNINILIRDLFHNPPSYKSAITLSWKSAVSAVALAKAGQPIHKRSVMKLSVTAPAAITTTATTIAANDGEVKKPTRTPITFSDGGPPPKKLAVSGPKQEKELYIPPSGKYSNKVSKFTLPTRGGGSWRSRGFGYTRGRGRGRGTYY